MLSTTRYHALAVGSRKLKGRTVKVGHRDADGVVTVGAAALLHVVVDYCHDRGRQHEQNKYNRKYFVFHLRLRFFMPHCADYFGQTR